MHELCDIKPEIANKVDMAKEKLGGPHTIEVSKPSLEDLVIARINRRLTEQ